MVCKLCLNKAVSNNLSAVLGTSGDTSYEYKPSTTMLVAENKQKRVKFY